MKIKKSLVEQIIKEETEKIKQIKVLQEERKNIMKQLNELYDEGDMAQETGTLEEASVNWEDPAAVQQGHIDYWKNQFATNKLYKGIKQPSWTIDPSNPGFQKALEAVKQYKTFDIYYHPAKKQFLPRQYSAKSHTFGGGAGME